MDLGQALAAARRHWIMMLVVVMLGVAAGAAYQLLATPTYRSTATVYFSLNRSGGSVTELADGNSYVQDMVPSYALVATSPIVLRPVINDLGLTTSPDRLADDIDISHAPASVVMQIAVVTTDRKLTADIANSVAENLADAMVSLSPRTSSDTAVMNVTTLSKASPAPFQFSPNRNISLGGGLLGGLIIAITAVAIRESIVTRPLATRQDVERVTDFPVIGSIVNDNRAGQRPLPASTHPNVARAESFRILHTTLVGLIGDGPICFTVTSPYPGEGRSSTAVNLAVAMSHASKRVLLIDGDLRKPSIARLLGLDNERGLSDILGGTATLEQSVQGWDSPAWGLRNLDVITAGPPAGNPSELLASRRMGLLIDTVRNLFDVVILDTPPLMQSTDGAVLSAQVDGALMIIDAPRTKQRHLQDSLGRLSMAGADVLGVVLNRTAADSQLEYSAIAPTAVHEANPRHPRQPASAQLHPDRPEPDAEAAGPTGGAPSAVNRSGGGAASAVNGSSGSGADTETARPATQATPGTPATQGPSGPPGPAVSAGRNGTPHGPADESPPTVGIPVSAKSSTPPAS
jgi:polysaccharide biosynthesis transport protein